MILCGAVPKERAEKKFGNMIYHIEYDWVDDVKDVKLHNGNFYLESEYGFTEFDIHYQHRYTSDDFNHDGLKDVAVIYTENFGGNQWWYCLAFFINDGKKLVHKSTIYLDDRANIYSLHSKHGRVYLDMDVHQLGDCMGGPSKHISESYGYSGDNIFVKRAGSYVFEENAYGFKGMPDKNFKSLPSAPLGYNQGFVVGNGL